MTTNIAVFLIWVAFIIIAIFIILPAAFAWGIWKGICA